MSGNFELLPLEMTSGTVCGFSFASAKPRVLCRTPEKVLLLVPGYSSYVCHMGQTHAYSPTALWRFRRNQDGFEGAKKIAEGGRFTVARFKELGDQIDAAMGEDGLWQLLDPKRTLVLGACQPFHGNREGYWGPRKLGWGYESTADRVSADLAKRKGQ